MSRINQRHLSDLRGVTRLAIDATLGITGLVEKLHHTIQTVHPPVGVSRAGSTGGLTGFIYRSIRGTTRLVGQGIDLSLAPATALMPKAQENARRDALVSVLNGVYGDHLEKTGNPLALKMGLRHQGLPLDLNQPGAESAMTGHAKATGKVMLFIHGLCLNDKHWAPDGANQGQVLATELAYTPLYLRYNTGLPIESNGRLLAAMLENVLLDWPVPVTDLTIVGHSMGGLVARSACHHGSRAGHDWPQYLRHLVSIGTPHHGAPLERVGKWLDAAMDLSPYISPFKILGETRSAGINDLQHGISSDADQDLLSFPPGVQCYAMAATLGKKHHTLIERAIGDGLVPLDSALGKSRDPACSLAIPEERQWIGFETGHMELLGSPAVYKRLREWLQGEAINQV